MNHSNHWTHQDPLVEVVECPEELVLEEVVDDLREADYAAAVEVVGCVVVAVQVEVGVGY